MIARILYKPRLDLRPVLLIWIAVIPLLTADVVQSTVVVSEPSIYTISESDVICVARVDHVVAPKRFIDEGPTEVIVTVQDGIKGAKRGDILNLSGWDANCGEISELSGGISRGGGPRRKSQRINPPSEGMQVLFFLKRHGLHAAEVVCRTMHGPVVIIRPDTRTIETVRGTVWLTFAMKPIPEWKRPRHPVSISGKIANHSPDWMWFDMRHARVTYASTPTDVEPGERWRPHPPSAIRLAPGEVRECSFNLEDIAPVPIGMPGFYWFGLDLPANVNGQGSHVPLRFRIGGRIMLSDAAATSRAVFAATVDKIYPFQPHIGPVRGVSLSDHEFLLGALHSSPPGNVSFVDWRRDLPLRAARGRRYLFFLGRHWQVFHVAEMNERNLRQVRTGLASVDQNMR